MKSFLYTTITIIIASIIVMTITPWWVVAIVGFIVGLAFGVKPLAGFASGLVAVFLVWIVATVIADSGNQISVAELMSEVIGGLPPIGVMIITGLIGGIVAGFGAMTGSLTRYILKPQSTEHES